VIDMAARRALQDQGYAVGEALGSGMEGTVLGLDGGLVAKVWFRRTETEAARLAGFYDAVARAGVDLRTPRIRRVLAVHGRAVTVEDRLGGRPLPLVDESSPHRDDATIDCLLDVLAALATVDPSDPALASLPVLEGEEPFDPSQGFECSLAGLVERRVAESRLPLARHLPDLDRIEVEVAAALRGLTPATPGLLHGDLIPANVLVTGGSRPTVLDFGFLTAVGDPAFDAAVTASIHDMYGPRARETERVLDVAIADRFGHDPRRIAVYRAAYALATATCFSPEGVDGHFAWCVAMLGRADIREALGH
jgi:aminoglycoside phosphotransferase (APT) family kinase protein